MKRGTKGDAVKTSDCGYERGLSRQIQFISNDDIIVGIYEGQR